jgi:hypothetical protein
LKQSTQNSIYSHLNVLPLLNMLKLIT